MRRLAGCETLWEKRPARISGKLGARAARVFRKNGLHPAKMAGEENSGFPGLRNRPLDDASPYFGKDLICSRTIFASSESFGRSASSFVQYWRAVLASSF